MLKTRTETINLDLLTEKQIKEWINTISTGDVKDWLFVLIKWIKENSEVKKITRDLPRRNITK